jgi:hypothetical protein
MSGQWLRASKALEIVSRESGEWQAIRSLCSRAHQGLVRARAQLLVIDEEKESACAVPEQFWWAQGEAALDQDWTRGDFSTCVDRDSHWQAFGVEFGFEGVKQMLAPEAAATLTRELSTANNPEWMTAAAARRHLHVSNFTNPTSADAVLLDQCRLGLVAGRAMKMEQTLRGLQPMSREVREWDIPEWFWTEFTNTGASSQDWNRGVFHGDGKAPEGSGEIVLTGVYFLAQTLPNAPRPAADAMESQAAKAGKGRPAKGFWDDLWCGVWGSIYHGDFDPKTQAEIERAMHDWISEHGHDASESSVRSRARKMFDEMIGEGKK